MAAKRRSAFQGLFSESDKAILSHLEQFGEEEKVKDAADYILVQFTKLVEGQHKWSRDQQVILQLMDGAVNAGKLSPDYKDYVTIQILAGMNVERMARVIASISDLYNQAKRHGYQSAVERQNQILKAALKQVMAITVDSQVKQILFVALQQLMLEAGLPLEEFKKFAAAIPPPQTAPQRALNPDESSEDED